MEKNVLVIGGSYFVGRVFNMVASAEDGWNMTVVNRGRFSLGLPNVLEHRCDRHDTERFLTLVDDKFFDAVIDFCAYRAGEIVPIVRGLGSRAGHYILISSCSVYDRAASTNVACTEKDSVLGPQPTGPIGDYINGKVALEGELESVCSEASIPFTVLRPAFVYGPYNYAPRESWYIERFVKGEPVPVPKDSNARFSFTYVTDIARALIVCCGDVRAYGETFNVVGPEHVDYTRLIDTLGTIHGKPLRKLDITIAQANANGIPLPFPLETDELYDGTRFADTFHFAYTPFKEGMAKAYRAFMSVYSD